MRTNVPILTTALANPVGVCFDARTIHAAQVSKEKEGWALSGAVCLQRTGKAETAAALTPAEVQRLRQAMALQGMNAGHVVIAAPAGFATLTAMELPPRSSGAPLEQIAGMELSRLQKLDAGTFEISLWELPKAQNRARAGAESYIAATATHAAGEALSAAFDGSGLAVRAIVPEALTIAKAAGTGVEHRAVVSVNMHVMDVVVLGEEGKVVYHRALPELGLHRLYTTLKERATLSLEAAEGAIAALAAGDKSPSGEDLNARMKTLTAAVARAIADHAEFVAVEVGRSLAYASRYSPDCEQKPVRVVGAGAKLPGLCEHLSKHLELSCAPLACGELVRVLPGSVWTNECRVVAAIGASMWTLATSGRLVA